jgi:hypothetical protein
MTEFAIHVWDAETGKQVREADQWAFDSWMTISSQTGESVLPNSRHHDLSFHDVKGLSIGSDGRLKLVTQTYYGAHLWVEKSQ